MYMQHVYAHEVQRSSLTNELNVSAIPVSFNEFYQPACSQHINTLYITSIIYHPQCLRSQRDRLSNVRLRHSGFRPRKRRTA